MLTFVLCWSLLSGWHWRPLDVGTIRIDRTTRMRWFGHLSLLHHINRYLWELIVMNTEQKRIADELSALASKLEGVARVSIVSTLAGLADDVKALELSAPKAVNQWGKTHFKILDLLHKSDVPLSVEHIALCLGVTRSTAYQYILHLRSRFHVPLVYRLAGRPKRVALHHQNIDKVCRMLERHYRGIELVHLESFVYSADVHNALKKISNGS